MASLSDFEAEMNYLYENGYRIISIQEFERWYDREIEFPKKTAVITFDDGDYELYYLVYPILRKYGFSATSFLVGAFTPETTNELTDNTKNYVGKDIINLIRNEYPDLQFQSHTYDLHYKTEKGQYAVDIMRPDELDNDFKQNKIFGFEYIAYPYGQHNDNLINVAKANGMKMGFAFRKYVCATRNDDRYAIPRVKINGQITYSEFVSKMNSFLK